MTRPYTLSIAGYDATAGAGLLADIKTFEMHDVYGMGVMTGNTFQTDSEFSGVDWIPLETIKKQLKLLLDAYDIQYVKIGIVESFKVLKEIVVMLKYYKPDAYIIWDPVLKSSSGFLFHEDQSMDMSFVESHIDLITPNWDEYYGLYPDGISSEKRHCDILVKGGHRNEKEGMDLLICGAKMIEIQGKPFGRKSKHGTGCVLSASILSNLAKGETLEQACRKAKKYTENLILSNTANLGFHHTGITIHQDPNIKKNIDKFQLITRDHQRYSHPDQIEIAFRNGCKWVQLRIKDRDDNYIEEQALKAMESATKFNGILIINDNPILAKRVGAHGVHLGKNDMSVNDAREILGPDAIIGGTANTFEDIQHLVSQNVDYIGLGPYRFTKTKDNLSPIVGLEGYKNILKQVAENNIDTPIIAIGGITLDDISGLMEAGLYGIAVSGAIHYSEFEKSYKEFMKKLKSNSDEILMK